MHGSDRGKNQAPESTRQSRAQNAGGPGADAQGRDAPPGSRRSHDPGVEGPLVLSRRDGALIITIEREERRNALSLATLEAFGNVFRHHLAPDDRAVIVTG